jgi:uncharacterized membrane protein
MHREEEAVLGGLKVVTQWALVLIFIGFFVGWVIFN